MVWIVNGGLAPALEFVAGCHSQDTIYCVVLASSILAEHCGVNNVLTPPALNAYLCAVVLWCVALTGADPTRSKARSTSSGMAKITVFD